jgi:hypothetical protein
VGTTGSTVAIADNDVPRGRLFNNTATDAVSRPISPFGQRPLTDDLKDDVITTLLA